MFKTAYRQLCDRMEPSAALIQRTLHAEAPRKPFFTPRRPSPLLWR